jgi:hypothetical protein
MSDSVNYIKYALVKNLTALITEVRITTILVEIEISLLLTLQEILQLARGGFLVKLQESLGKSHLPGLL